MKKRIKNIRLWLAKKIQAITPGKNAIQGASKGLFWTTAILFILFVSLSTRAMGDLWILLLFIIISVALILIALLVNLLIRRLHLFPKILKIALIICVPVLFMALSGEALYVLVFSLTSLLIGAAISVLYKTTFNRLTTPKKVITILGLLMGISGIAMAIIHYIPKGIETDPITNAAQLSANKIPALDISSPATHGSFTVKTLTYGSGNDKHRSEFSTDVSIKTDVVNGVAFLDNWSGFGGWYREKYWGFDEKSLPLNAYVWYPEGEGPFPLALIVHGNHSMQDYSDVGYEYLGELLASRGIIFASVDENFLNGSWSDITGGLEEENDARGWLLLEHLRQWHEWNVDSNSPFYQKIDTTKLALIGHSRGGEAVAHAALLNSLSHYPDDATIPLDYHYNIEAVAAIAPVDGQYEPGNTRSALKDVNYFVLHGSQDADVSSFAGSKQYERITFSDSLYHFKSGLYIYGANHGQFNTSWGNNDVGTPFTRLLNLKQLLTAEEQREIAKVYLSAFFEVTLKDDKKYLPLFSDARSGKNWLPETIYLNQFQDASFAPLASFDEDFEVTTTTADSIQISSKNLTVWKEQEIQLKWGKKGSRAAYIGWHYDEDLLEKQDSLNGKKQFAKISDSIRASYSLKRLKPFKNMDSTSVLTFSLAESTADSSPKTKGKWIDNNNSNDEKEEDPSEGNDTAVENEDSEQENNNDEETEDENEPEPPIDFSIQLTDTSGQSVVFPLSRFSALQRQIDVKLWKISEITGDSQSENIFQTYIFPLEALGGLNSEFDINQINTVDFIFDKTSKGVIILDNIGFMKNF